MKKYYLLLTILILMFSMNCWAAEKTRYYDRNTTYRGYSEKTGETTRYYNNWGRYQGSSTERAKKTIYRDKWGVYVGTSIKNKK